MHDLSALANRLKKVHRTRRSWAKQQGVEAYRLYEMDIPELRYIVALYGTDAVLYDKRGSYDEEDPQLDEEVAATVGEALGLPREKVHFKKRRRLRTDDGPGQYEKLGESGQRFEVKEGAARYLVNLDDYLDTGLFLDHRPLRLQFQKLPPGIRFLNLFCYTGAVSIAAAVAGAKTTSIDMSSTYLEWAAANFRANGLDPNAHRLERHDALAFCDRGPAKGENYDVIFLDPPTFSNSKKMQTTWDVQRDHAALIERTMRFLAPTGVLYFSTNRQRFGLDESVAAKYQVEDITEQTIPDDFRNRKIHHCFTVRWQR